MEVRAWAIISETGLDLDPSLSLIKYETWHKFLTFWNLSFLFYKVRILLCWNILGPWLVWLSGLSAGLWTRGLWVQFTVRAHAGVVGQVPSSGYMRGNHTMMFLSLSFSLLPFSLKQINKILKNKKNFLKRNILGRIKWDDICKVPDTE